MGKGSNSRSPLSADPLPPQKKVYMAKQGYVPFFFENSTVIPSIPAKKNNLAFFLGGEEVRERFLSEWVIPSMARNIFFSPSTVFRGEEKERNKSIQRPFGMSAKGESGGTDVF